MKKRRALGTLALVAILVPFSEVLLTGRSEVIGRFALLEGFLLIPPVYWWYHIDKTERQYEASTLMNVCLIAFLAIALPIYFVSSRGWKRGVLATLGAFGVLVVIGILGAVGATIGAIARYST